MTHPADKSAPLPEELANAYRRLPAVEPSEALDAQVRSAVVADFEVTKHRRSQSMYHQWRHRSLLAPLATAAALLLTVGGAYMLLPQYHRSLAPQQSNRAAAQNLLAPIAAPKPPAVSTAVDALAEVSARQEAETKPPVLKLDMPAPSPAEMAAPPPKPAAATASYAAATQDQSALRSASAEVPAALSPPAAVADSATGPTTALVHQGLAGDAYVPADAPATLEEVRRLSGTGQRDAARKMLQRWQSQHRDEAVPEDLRPLLDDTAPQ